MPDFFKLTENLNKLGYEVTYFETANKAAEYIDKEVDGKTVGFGGSVTLKQLDLYMLLSKHNVVYWHWEAKDNLTNEQILINEQNAQIYFSSVNGISENGEIVNIDGTCNRVSAIAFGHEKVYLVVGANKIAESFEAALNRARNIAAPKNAKRLLCKTPCAVNADKCYNCDSPDRICKELSVLWRRPTKQKIEIVLINEELGY